MDDYENDGRDYNENIDEGPTDVENEYFFTKKRNAAETKTGVPEKKPADIRRGRSCDCKDTKKRKLKRSKTNSTNNGNDTNGTNGKNDKKNGKDKRDKKNQNNKNNKNDKKDKNNQNNKSDTQKNIQRSEVSNKGKRGRKKKERRLVNPFIIFYLEMYYKNPTKCVAEIATEAGKLWSKMSAKEKEEYIHKARLASAKSKTAKLESKKMQKGKTTKRTQKHC